MTPRSTILRRATARRPGPAAPREPARPTSASGEYFFTTFGAGSAPLVASWVQTEQELTWLAPGTPPPLTPDKVVAWGKDREHRLLFWGAAERGPIGYAELNPMPGGSSQMWIGHFVIDPRRRGRSLGSRFARALLARAFLECGATEVLLVVFVGNSSAICCYQSAGMKMVGQERKFFKATRQEHQFLRMSITKARYRRLVSTGKLASQPLPLRARPESC